MISIRNSKFSMCNECELLTCPSCICETNCEDDLSKVDIVICAENPGKTEIEKGVPLIGKSGQVFRKYFDKYLKGFNYLITNCVLCVTLNPDGTTGNPSDQVIERCKHNLFAMIDVCNPKLILSLGTSPMKAFGIGKSGITSLRGKVFKWKDRDILVTYHPSFVARNMYRKEDESLENFENDIRLAAIMLGSDITVEKKSKEITGKGIFYYSIPDKYYSSNYRLIDIHHLRKTKKLVYIFRDKDNRKEYYQTNDDYYCYQVQEGTKNTMILSYDKLNQIKIDQNDRDTLDSEITYEGDLKITDKHVIDYFIKKKEEPVANEMNTIFIDIEILMGDSKEFPNPVEVKLPICLISSSYHNRIRTYLLDNNLQKVEKIEGVEIKVFKDEISLLKSFISDLKKDDPDFITGWNVINFDLCYIINRIKVLHIQESLSKYGECIVDPVSEFIDIPGFVCVDMLRLYKEFSGTKQENNKLGTIAQVELGQDKIFIEEGLGQVYNKDINKFIEYNIRDVTLLVDLDKKLNHIKFLNELRNICTGSFRSCQSTFGRLDCLVVGRLKRLGLGSRNKVSDESKEFPDAYVKEPIKGIHDYIVDLDFTGLYPSIIITYNIGANTFVCKFKEMTDGYDFIYNQEKLCDPVTIIIDPLNDEKETVVSKKEFIDFVKNQNLVYTINGCFYKPHNVEKSVFSEILIDLMNSRKSMKDLMKECIVKKDSQNEKYYDSRQLAFKILANALYGVLGTSIFRFFNVDLASSVTLSGQEAIKTSILHANDYLSKLKTKSTKETNIVITKSEMYGEMTRDTPYVITGDTDSLFATFESFFPRKIDSKEVFEKVTPMVDGLQEYLNTKVVKNIIDKHNVPSQENRLELKNELMIKRGLFLAKKRYANYVISKENKKIDKIVPMGLEIKRSDYSSSTKQALKELLDLILRSEIFSFSKVKTFCKSREKEFIEKIKAGDRSACKPSSFTKSLKEYTRVPPGVEAMINWNNLMYSCFYPGTRGYFVKLKGIDLDKAPKDVQERYYKHFTEPGKKLEYICFPDEEKSLPNFFVVDVKEMIKFHWTDRYNLLLEPLFSMQNEILTA